MTSCHILPLGYGTFGCFKKNRALLWYYHNRKYCHALTMSVCSLCTVSVNPFAAVGSRYWSFWQEVSAHIVFSAVDVPGTQNVTKKKPPQAREIGPRLPSYECSVQEVLYEETSRYVTMSFDTTSSGISQVLFEIQFSTTTTHQSTVLREQWGPNPERSVNSVNAIRRWHDIIHLG